MCICLQFQPSRLASKILPHPYIFLFCCNFYSLEALAFSYVVRTKKGPLLYHTCTWFVTRKAPCYLAVTWERCRTKILKGLCGVIGWFQVAADITLPFK